MTSFRIERAAFAPESRFYIGRETGALYVKLLHECYVCVGPNGAMAVGEKATTGKFDLVPTGSTITIEV